jgi:hypothetical protein
VECIEAGAILRIGREQLFNFMFDYTEIIEPILFKIKAFEPMKDIK